MHGTLHQQHALLKLSFHEVLTAAFLSAAFVSKFYLYDESIAPHLLQFANFIKILVQKISCTGKILKNRRYTGAVAHGLGFILRRSIKQ